MNPFSLHLPNDKPLEPYHWDIIARVQPGLVVVCEPYFSDVPRLREAVPGITIIGRMYGDQSLGISNWSRPDDRALANMAEFGRRSGHKANQYDIDIMTPFNEPSIDMSIPTTPDGFSLIAQMFIDWLIGYRQTTTRKAGTIALAPGGREDDDGGWGYRGADILRPAFDLADVLLLHNYWNRGTDTYGVPLVQSEWEGDRARRQLAAYGWTKEWAITECNRPLKEDSEKAEIATQARVFIDQHAAKPGFLGACWFILDTADDQFREHRMVNNDFLINEAVAINTDYAARGHQPPGEPNTVPGGPETPETPSLNIPAALIAAAIALAPGASPSEASMRDWTRDEIIARIIAYSDAAGVPRRLSLACGIAESNLRQYATREGKWPDVSYGIGQQIVLYAPVGNGKDTPENRELVKQWLYDPENAIPLMVGKLAANYDNRIKAGYSDADAQMLALAKYNSGQWTIPSDYSANYDNYRRGFIQADAILATWEEELTPERKATIRVSLDKLWALSSAFEQNADHVNAEYIKAEVIRIKEAARIG